MEVSTKEWAVARIILARGAVRSESSLDQTWNIYVREIQQHLHQHMHMHIWIDSSTICMTLKRLGMTRQKIKHVAL